MSKNRAILTVLKNSRRHRPFAQSVTQAPWRTVGILPTVMATPVVCDQTCSFPVRRHIEMPPEGNRKTKR